MNRLTRKPRKKIRISRSEQYLVNLKYMGSEPEFNSKEEISVELMARAFNWYGYMANKEEARQYMVDFLESQARRSDITKFKEVSDKNLPYTACWIARIICRGGIVSNKHRQFLENELFNSINKKDTNPVFEEQNTSIVEKPSNIQSKIKEKIENLLGDVEKEIDNNHKFSLYDHLKSNNIPAIYANKIIEYYTPWINELNIAYQGTDKDIKEAYRHLSKKQLKERLVFFSSLIEDANRYNSNVKKTRKPRKQKPITSEKVLKFFVYQKEDTENKIVSVNPEKILGSQELWVYNTRYKILTVFRAKDANGLQVYRTAITNFDEASSMSKRIGRKAKEYIDMVLKSGKVQSRKILTDIKTEIKLNERVNENTVILKVI